MARSDNDIIKALECCISDECTCKKCAYEDTKHIVNEEFETMPNGKTYDEWSCDEWLKVDLFNLINRQQAKIERLEYEIMKTKLEKHLLNETVEEIKAEAIKEFAERLKANFDTYTDDEEANALYMRRLIDNLVKEMVGDNE